MKFSKAPKMGVDQKKNVMNFFAFAMPFSFLYFSTYLIFVENFVKKVKSVISVIHNIDL